MVKIPLPREHGAWVMLLGPWLAGVIAAWPVPWLPEIELLVAVVGIFLTRQVVALWLRRRDRAGRTLLRWGATYMCLALIGVVPLGLGPGRAALLLIGAIAGVIFLVHSILMLWPAGRMDRSQAGEVLGAAALSLTAAAAWVVAGRPFNLLTGGLVAASTLGFASGIIHVKTLLRAAKIRTAFSPGEQQRCRQESLIFHGALLTLFVLLAICLPHRTGLLVLIGFIPLALRGLKGAWFLTNRLPPLQRVGLAEMAYALWLMVWLGCAVRVY